MNTVEITGHRTGAGEPADDVAIVAGIRASDDRAFEMLVRRYGDGMFSVARRMLPCEQDAADAVQDAFISAYRSIGSFEGHAKLSTWLHRITVNACLMKLRSGSRRASASIEDLLPQFDETGRHAHPVRQWSEETFARVAADETRAQVRAAIDKLPEPYRMVLLLRDIQELSTDETAQILGCTTANVKTRLHRARQALRELLQAVFASSAGVAA